jgi:hypothetical protein
MIGQSLPSVSPSSPAGAAICAFGLPFLYLHGKIPALVPDILLSAEPFSPLHGGSSFYFAEDPFMFETWQIIAILVVVVGLIGFFVWKKKQGG